MGEQLTYSQLTRSRTNIVNFLSLSGSTSFSFESSTPAPNSNHYGINHIHIYSNQWGSVLIETKICFYLSVSFKLHFCLLLNTRCLTRHFKVLMSEKNERGRYSNSAVVSSKIIHTILAYITYVTTHYYRSGLKEHPQHP